MQTKCSSLLTLEQLNQIRAHIITNPLPNLLNSLLRSFTLSTNPQNALLLYNQMVHQSTSHDHFTYTFTLRACSLLQAFEKGHEVHARTIKSGHLSDIFIQNSLIHLYVSSKNISSASEIFDLITLPDVVSWTTLMSGLVNSGLDAEALLAIRRMNVRPTSVTLVTILSACSNLRALKLGKAIHAYYMRNLSDEKNIFVNNAILNLYASSGSFRSAHNLFETMGTRDVVSWTTILGGYAHGGYHEDAINTFQNMLHRREVQPNEATLVNILYLCGKVGNLILGKWVHCYVDGRDDIILDGNVGNALVNMYAKCGEMGMALEVFNTLKCKDLVLCSTIIGGLAMNGYGKQVLEMFSVMICRGITPDGVTFISLLSACSHAGLIEMGKVFFEAMQRIYGITPKLEHYACMVDMYGRAGLLVETEAIFKEMPVKPDGPLLGALVNASKFQGHVITLERVKQSVRSGVASGGTYALLSNIYSNLNRWNEAKNIRDDMRCLQVRKTIACSSVNVDDASHR